MTVLKFCKFLNMRVKILISNKMRKGIFIVDDVVFLITMLKGHLGEFVTLCDVVDNNAPASKDRYPYCAKQFKVKNPK